MICIFLGPTLPEAEARELLNASFEGPARQGDVDRGARIIGVVDGYFESMPAVWHKEILWAISQGVAVYGSASRGALRAAELAAFGMIGVGAIYESYRDGVFEDDSEVAVRHGPRESGYRVGSEAMVNVRATLQAASRAEVLTARTRAQLLELAGLTFYPDGHYPGLLEAARREGLPEAELSALESWLPEGRVNQKKLDALLMLRAIAEASASDRELPPASFELAESKYWHAALNAARSPQPAPASSFDLRAALKRATSKRGGPPSGS